MFWCSFPHWCRCRCWGWLWFEQVSHGSSCASRLRGRYRNWSRSCFCSICLRFFNSFDWCRPLHWLCSWSTISLPTWGSTISASSSAKATSLPSAPTPLRRGRLLYFCCPLLLILLLSLQNRYSKRQVKHEIQLTDSTATIYPHTSRHDIVHFLTNNYICTFTLHLKTTYLLSPIFFAHHCRKGICRRTQYPISEPIHPLKLQQSGNL